MLSELEARSSNTPTSTDTPEHVTGTDVGDKRALDVYVRGGGSGGGGSSIAPFSSGNAILVSVGPASSIIAAANANRLFLRVSHYTPGASVWFQYNAAAVIGRGFRLSPGTFFEIKTDALFTGDVHAVTDGSTINIDVFEGS